MYNHPECTCNCALPEAVRRIMAIDAAELERIMAENDAAIRAEALAELCLVEMTASEQAALYQAAELYDGPKIRQLSICIEDASLPAFREKLADVIESLVDLSDTLDLEQENEDRRAQQSADERILELCHTGE